MDELPDVRARAQAIFEKAQYRCCSLEQFTEWYIGAQEIKPQGSNYYRPGFDPGSAAEFCRECMPAAREEIVAEGRCVFVEQPGYEARERMRRFRLRHRVLVLITK